MTFLAKQCMKKYKDVRLIMKILYHSKYKDFEDFTEIHPFRALTQTLEDGTVIRKHLFYCYKRNHKKETIKYRLVIDGLWVADPLNSNKEYDPF